MELSVAKTTLDNLRGKQGIFSVALSKNTALNCYGPFDDDDVIIFYNYTFINIGDSYNASTGIFTVPRSGVYSLAISLYGHHSPGDTSTTCANLQVNGKTMSSLPKTQGHEDKEDSSTVVMAVRLEAGDELAVSLPKGCVVCDKSGHMTAFTGCLLYATD
ncbi:complement C1q-like protein 4 [Notolabrus celidotus]|uniref:complement C1q-like protein 4 n=1 Tax=Notolabrus celidotus TaxID=1203425 RepID=UPI00148F8F19|nr:complement C1q-like protein 4 [Notolabrus celidotus]